MGRRSTLVDGHAHLDRGWPLGRALDRAADGFRRAAMRLTLDLDPIDPETVDSALCLVERPGDRSFTTLRAVDADPWTLHPTDDPDALLARRRGGDALDLHLIAGRQIRCDGGLEVLALGVRADAPELPPDGLPVAETVRRVIDAGAPAVLPWGFGKWWFDRGRRVHELLTAADPSTFFLGDTASRPGWVTPSPFTAAIRRGIRILPGSDPWPFARGDSRLATRGVVLDGAVDRDRPATWLREQLADRSIRPRPWGAHRSTFGAIADQARWRGHLWRGHHSRRQHRRGNRNPQPAVPSERRATQPASRILMVAPQPFFTPRGTPFSVRQRLAALAELGVGVDLLTYGEGTDVDIPGLRILRLPRLPIGPVPIGPSWRKLLLDALLAPRTAWHLARHRRRYAAVHAHEEAIFWCRAIAPRLGVPLIYDMHSSLPAHLRTFGHGRLAIGLFTILERWSLLGSDAVLTVSPELARHVEALLDRRGRADRHTLIENTFDVAEPTRGSTDQASTLLPEGRATILYAGTFEPYQGLELLIDAFGRVHDRRADAQLVLVGGTPPQIDALSSRADALGLGDAVTVHGRVEPAVAAALAQRAAVQVSPRVAGPTPLKVYAMLAAGTPIVATDVEGHRSAFDESVARLAAPEPAALADALLAAIDGDDRRVEAARKRHRARYGRDRYLDRLGDALERLEIAFRRPEVEA